MKLSELNPEDIEVVEEAPTTEVVPNTEKREPLKLSDIKDDDIEVIQEPVVATEAASVPSSSISNTPPPSVYNFQGVDIPLSPSGDFDYSTLGMGDRVTLDTYGINPMSGVTNPAKLEQREAARVGMKKGATLDFADEIEAGVGSLGSKTYDQALGEVRARDKSIVDKAPEYAAGGALAGGLATAAATPSLRAAKLAGSGVSGLLTRLGAGAAEGSTLGGLYGYGKSEKQGIEALKDAKDEALYGAAAGAAGPLIGAGLSKTGQLLGKIDIAKKGAMAFNAAKEGLDITLEESRRKISESGVDAAKQLLKKLKESKTTIGSEIGNVAKAAEKQGTRFNTDDLFKISEDLASVPGANPKDSATISQILNKHLYDQAPQKLKYTQKLKQGPSEATQSLKGQLEKGQVTDIPQLDEVTDLVRTKPSRVETTGKIDPRTGEPSLSTMETQVMEGTLPGLKKQNLTPEEFINFKKEIGKLQGTYKKRSNMGQELSDDEIYRKLSEVYGDLSDKSSNIAGYPELNKQYGKVAGTIEDLGGLERNSRLPDGLKVEKPAMDFMKKIKSLDGTDVQKYNAVKDGLETAFGAEKAVDILDNIKNKSEFMALAKEFATEKGLSSQSISKYGLLQSLTGGALKLPIAASAKAGTAARSLSQSVERGSTMGMRDLMKNPSGISDLSTAAAQKGYRGLSNIIKGLSDKSSTAKASTLFLIKSDPQYRQQLKELEDDFGE